MYRKLTQSLDVKAFVLVADRIGVPLSLLYQLIEQLVRHEGLRLVPYLCPAGKLTVGVGHNLDDCPLTETQIAVLGISEAEARARGITYSQAALLLLDDIDSAYEDVESLNLDVADPVRKLVFVNMAFNLGRTRLAGFPAMRAAAERGEWNRCADEMVDSVWYKQVKTRSRDLVQQMRTGLVV